jgi:anti-sigma B factor antagonist
MTVEHEILNQIDLIFLNGRIDAQSAPGVNEDIGKVIDEGRNKMLINFKGLEYISSAGLRVLITVAKKFKTSNGSLILCSLDEKIYEVFDVSGFTAIFQIFDTQEDALAEISA